MMLTKFDIEKYFIAEKQESLLFLIIGTTSILLSVILIGFFKNNFWRGAALPLLIIGILQFVVGFTVYKRSDTDRVNMVYALDMNPEKLQKEELPRMKVVNRNFVTYRWIEIILAFLGVIVTIKYKSNLTYQNSWNGNAFYYGIGIFLTVQSLLMLGADYFAEKRGLIYENQLSSFAEHQNKKSQ